MHFVVILALNQTTFKMCGEWDLNGPDLGHCMQKWSVVLITSLVPINAGSLTSTAYFSAG